MGIRNAWKKVLVPLRCLKAMLDVISSLDHAFRDHALDCHRQPLRKGDPLRTSGILPTKTTQNVRLGSRHQLLSEVSQCALVGASETRTFAMRDDMFTKALNPLRAFRTLTVRRKKDREARFEVGETVKVERVGS